MTKPIGRNFVKTAPYADVQKFGHAYAADADTQKELSPLLLKKYRESGFNTVRMEAIKLLSRYQDDNFIEALRERFERYL